jgi:DNA-directed RNA polymerase subunit beta
VNVGDRVESGDIIADGTSTDNGELALGKDVLVAFMPWNGYNYEDSILISQKIVEEDEFSSIHIQEYEIVARDTRLGPEEITRQLPGAAPESLLTLDEDGIITIGSHVEAGDILVGKVTPKTESILTPEEKLLRAIFGEKASEVRDTSLRVPPGEAGVVIDVRVFTRRGVEKNERAILIEKAEIDQLTRDYEGQIQIIEKAVESKLLGLLSEQKLTVQYRGFEVDKFNKFLAENEFKKYNFNKEKCKQRKKTQEKIQELLRDENKRNDINIK